MAELLERQVEHFTSVAPSKELSQIHVNIAEAYSRGEYDINFFASALLPTVMESELPLFYLETFKVLTLRKDVDINKILRFALGLPRGHAKTTFIKIVIAWLICYAKISFAVVVCANDDLAEALIGDISDALGTPNMEAIYGKWTDNLGTNSKAEKRCVYNGRFIVLKGKGAGSALRGINIGHKRPDLLFFDDAQTKECDESPTERLKFRKWLVATFKILAPKGDRIIIYVGNMYSDECILYQLKNNPTWVSLITGAILSNGQPLWPELHSLESLMESYIHDEAMLEADVWFAEVMNDPISRAVSLLSEMLDSSPMTEEDQPDGVFITVDPAGFKLHSDDNVIAVHYVWQGKGHIAEIDRGKELKDPEQLVLRTLQLAEIHGASLIGVEDAGYQSTLLFWFTKYMGELNIKGIEIVPLKPKNRAKEQRIRLFIAELYASNYYLFDRVKPAFVWQAMAYKIGKKDNKDDLLDACAYGLDVRNEYWHLVKNLRTAGIAATKAAVQMNNNPIALIGRR